MNEEEEKIFFEILKELEEYFNKEETKEILSEENCDLGLCPDE